MSQRHGDISRDDLRAHEAWLRAGRQGPGRLAIADLRPISPLHARDLTAARLERVDLSGCGLGYASLPETELRACSFDGADLTSVTFDDARLVACSFVGAAGPRVKFPRATIVGGRFERASLHASTWTGARVEATSFAAAALCNALLTDATFVGCDFQGAWMGPVGDTPDSLRGAVFVDCDLRGADFTRATLDGATFRRCRFEGARGEPRTARGVVIEDADLGGAAEVLARLAAGLDEAALLARPGPLVAAVDPADPERRAVFAIGQGARLLARVPATPAIARLRPGVTFARSGVLWSAQDDVFTVWDPEARTLEVRGAEVHALRGTFGAAGVLRVRAVEDPEHRGARRVRLETSWPGAAFLGVVTRHDLSAEADPTYTWEEARADGRWATALGAALAARLDVPFVDDALASGTAGVVAGGRRRLRIAELVLDDVVARVRAATDVARGRACHPLIEEELAGWATPADRLEALRNYIGLAAIDAVASPAELAVAQPLVEAFLRTHHHPAAPPTFAPFPTPGKPPAGPRLTELARAHPDLGWDAARVQQLLWQAIQVHAAHELDAGRPPAAMYWGPAAGAAHALLILVTVEACAALDPA